MVVIRSCSSRRLTPLQAGSLLLQYPAMIFMHANGPGIPHKWSREDWTRLREGVALDEFAKPPPFGESLCWHAEALQPCEFIYPSFCWCHEPTDRSHPCKSTLNKNNAWILTITYRQLTSVGICRMSIPENQVH